jgi:hypothetical protein
MLVVVTMLEGENGQKLLRKTGAVLFGRHFQFGFISRFEENLLNISETDQMIFNSCL